MEYESSYDEEEDDEHTLAIQKMRSEWTPEKIALVDSLYEICMYKNQMHLIASERYKKYDDWLSYPSVLINAVISTALFTNVASTFENGTSQISVFIIYINIACAVFSTIAAVLSGILLRLEPGKTSQKFYVTSTMYEYIASTIKTESAYKPWAREDFEMFYSRIETSMQHINSTAPSLPSDIRKQYTKVPDKPFEQRFKLNVKQSKGSSSTSEYNNNNNNNRRNTRNTRTDVIHQRIPDNNTTTTSSEEFFDVSSKNKFKEDGDTSNRNNYNNNNMHESEGPNVHFPDEEDEEQFKRNLFLQTKQGIIDEQNRILAERKRKKNKAKRDRKHKNNNNLVNIMSCNEDRSSARKAMKDMKLYRTKTNPKELKSCETEVNGHKIQAGLTIQDFTLPPSTPVSTAPTVNNTHNNNNNNNNNTASPLYDEDAVVVDLDNFSQ